MKNSVITTIFLIILIFSLFLFLSGCWHKGELIEETIVVDLEDCNKVQTTIAIYIGNLTISGMDQQSLLISDFSYNLVQWAPQVTLTVENKEGILKVVQKENEKGILNSLINNWILAFNPNIPLELDIMMGSGENQLDLSSIKLTSLKAAMGTGDTTIDMIGNYQENISVYLVGGIGHTTIDLPEEIGISLLIKGGLNRINCGGFSHIGNFYYNSAFDFSERKIYITLFSGLGIVDINLMPSG